MARLSPMMIIPLAIFAGFVGLALVGMMREDPEALPSARLNQPAPAVQVEAMQGEPGFTDADLRDGQVKLVNFWASWCAPCRVEHPNLTALAQEGIPVLGVNYKDKPENARAFLDELGNPYAALGADRSGRMALDWGVYGVPETYVIGADGTVLMRFAGPVTQRVIDEKFRPLLERQTAAD
ncbi:DsbE family thiol:disulfide interchange protein [Pontibaca methylaminivorans]|uniref:Cytochrome c biogenesis protein CcmG, thiol:disulfide interchange protein DsbE n=1 Tax=Pontibaca methylaminivorans TaxID=515897 RepID=A0A1R3X2H2_9RHOB|nr:DsbE family thiol:disulfide interchange protein [Pontibaca methylaminivorans]SIT84704.1 cytochrome c biogenesis protein CcmG, thiol:disulfide interchange protein DsbE [Pontibaca methylaminivorans]